MAEKRRDENIERRRGGGVINKLEWKVLCCKKWKTKRNNKRIKPTEEIVLGEEKEKNIIIKNTQGLGSAGFLKVDEPRGWLLSRRSFRG